MRGLLIDKPRYTIYQSKQLELRIRMLTLIDISKQQLKDLTALCLIEQTSRAELVRRAIGLYLSQQKQEPTAAFGAWKIREVDGQSYQVQLRSEW
jgi:hypothetical protein